MQPLSRWTRRTVAFTSLAWVVAATVALALWVACSLIQLRGAFETSAGSLGGTLTHFGVDLHAPLRDWLPLLAMYGAAVPAPAGLFVLSWLRARRRSRAS